MSDTPPERFKPIDELSAEEHFEHVRTGKRPETDDWKATGREPSLEEMTPEDHFDALRRRP